jgi:hypothetical protein
VKSMGVVIRMSDFLQKIIGASHIRHGDKLRNCEICGEPVPMRPHQLKSARACGPRCARVLAVKEHPDLENRMSQRERAVLWKAGEDDAS